MKPKQSQIKFSSAPNPQTCHFALPAAAPRHQIQTQTSYKSTPNITIDRLVLHLPNLTPAQAKDLAHRVGAALAAAHPTLGSTSLPFLPIELAPRTPTGDIPRLADAIVRALLTQIGRS